jgi:hypothetical protein
MNRGKPKNSEKKPVAVPLSHMHYQSVNPGLRVERPATDRLRHLVSTYLCCLYVCAYPGIGFA